jgi:hypothetical protein
MTAVEHTYKPQNFCEVKNVQNVYKHEAMGEWMSLLSDIAQAIDLTVMC